ncbi:efflux RND transporter periplasmic adaptor subunit [Candidatus Falkowbacteria bacterium]|nr:efflux RND transporter periplasmic adaptor subunit [Candidatus Falkowbacteria bacterium]
MLTKKRIIYLTLGLAAIIIIIAIFSSTNDAKNQREIVTVTKMDLIQEVNVTGNIKPAEEVSLSFEKAGKVAVVSGVVGQQIKAHEILVILSNADLAAQLKQAQASVESAKSGLLQYQAGLDKENAKLIEYQKGTKLEEVQLAQTGVANAEKSLADAEKNLNEVEQKALADLDDDYSSALTSALSAETTAETSLLTITDIQTKYYNGTDTDSNLVANKKASVVLSLLGEPNAGRYNKDDLNKLSGGTKAIVAQAQLTQKGADIANALFQLKSRLQIIRNTLTAIPIANVSAADITLLNIEKTNIDSAATTINSKEQAIAIQKLTNENNATAAKISVTTAKNNLLTAKDQLAIKKSGYTAEQIAGQAAQVKQAEANLAGQQAQIKYAEANVANILAQLGKTVIRSPINGTIAEVNVKVGEISSLDKPAMKIISAAKFQIETNVPEIDIAKIKVNDEAEITLDAFGDETKFSAVVIKIDPAEKIIEGVPTYKVTLELQKDAPGVKSGMSANITIITGRKENILSLPSRAVHSTNGDKYALVIQKDGTGEKVKIKTGERDGNGNVEITEGLIEGDQVVVINK